jgi:DNA-binding MarR family transcriptional regulator
MNASKGRSRAAVPTVAEGASTAARGPGRAVARLARHLEKALAPLDLSLPQYRVLALLAEGTAGSSTLANRLSVSPPSVTAVVDGLVSRGLVVRTPHAADRRRLDLELTNVGERLLADADESVNARLEAIAAHLGTGDRRDAAESLRDWHDALDEYREDQRREATLPRTKG